MLKRRFANWIVVCMLLLVLALGVAVSGKLTARPASAAPVGNPAIYTCSPDLIVSANVRVVAHCLNPYHDADANTNIYWFAYPTSDSAGASRMLSLFETARATSSTVTFYFSTNDPSGAVYGCQSNDCRAIWAATSP